MVPCDFCQAVFMPCYLPSLHTVDSYIVIGDMVLFTRKRCEHIPANKSYGLQLNCMAIDCTVFDYVMWLAPVAVICSTLMGYYSMGLSCQSYKSLRGRVFMSKIYVVWV